MKSLTLVLVFLSVFIFASCSSDGETSVEQINVEEAQIRAEKGILFVDVRSEAEIKELAYDVKNIIAIPLGDLENNLDKISKDKEVILVCRSGGRSNQAANILIKNGYSKVANMEGGIMAWSGAGFATQKNGASSHLNKKSCSAEGKEACTKGDKSEKSCSAEDKEACAKGDKSAKSCSKAEKAACELEAGNEKACCSSKGA